MAPSYKASNSHIGRRGLTRPKRGKFLRIEGEFLKQACRLERHYFRSKRSVDLHISEYALVCVLKMPITARARPMGTATL